MNKPGYHFTVISSQVNDSKIFFNRVGRYVSTVSTDILIGLMNPLATILFAIASTKRNVVFDRPSDSISSYISYTPKLYQKINPHS